MEATIVCWGYTGIMENKMAATLVHWGYNGIMKNKMETTLVNLWIILGEWKIK